MLESLKEAFYQMEVKYGRLVYDIQDIDGFDCIEYTQTVSVKGIEFDSKKRMNVLEELQWCSSSIQDAKGYLYWENRSDIGMKILAQACGCIDRALEVNALSIVERDRLSSIKEEVKSFIKQFSL
tara:strand:- start:725 stop:1099 length:375 start_codon:yes stop_codon:yes gene_type:complete